MKKLILSLSLITFGFSVGCGSKQVKEEAPAATHEYHAPESELALPEEIKTPEEPVKKKTSPKKKKSKKKPKV